MRAIAVESGASKPVLIDIDRPDPSPNEALVRTLRVGIDGTDHEVLAGDHGDYPDEAGYQVLGHEAVGVVEDASGTDLKEGQLVVPTVRRPPSEGTNEYFERGEPDMAPSGAYVERGIVGAHGYMADYFTSAAEFLVPVPEQFAKNGFLVEPISNAEKAIELAVAARSTTEWAPETAFVLGNGPLGLLTLALLDRHDTVQRCYCLGRRDRPDPTIEIIDELGATYVDSRETPLSAFTETHEPADIIVEATGHAPHAFEMIEALAPRGVGALLGIPGDSSFEIAGGRLHRELVLENRTLVGSVNSHIPHFEAAIQTLADYPDWFTDAIISHVFEPEAAESAFETGNDRIKVVIEFGQP